MIGAGKGDVFSEPGRRGKGKRFFFGGEFHFRKGQGSQVSFKKIQLCRQAAGKRDHIPLLADQPSVDLGQEMLVSLSGERKIVFFPRHQAAGFISEFIAVIVPPDADDGRNIQIPLLDDPAGILFQMIRKMRDQVFAFNLHGRYLLNSGNIIIYFTFRVNGDNMEKTRRNDGMKKVSVILADGFEEIEALTVVDLLRRAQIFVDTVSATEEYTVHGAHGINVQTEDLFDEVNFVESDMIVLPGGMPGTTHLNEHAGVRRVVKDFYEDADGNVYYTEQPGTTAVEYTILNMFSINTIKQKGNLSVENVEGVSSNNPWITGTSGVYYGMKKNMVEILPFNTTNIIDVNPGLAEQQHPCY